MTAVATREAAMAGGGAESAVPAAARLFEPRGPTLEDRIVAAWDELTEAGRVRCPVCSGEMTLAEGCESCGSALA